MDSEHYKYVTVDDAANLCQPGRWLAKVYLKHAYRSVGTHPDGWRDTGMSWCFNDSKHPTYFYDKRLPFRVRASPMVFHRFAQAISRMMARRGYTMLSYLDDFLFIEPTQRLCKGNFWHPVSQLHCQPVQSYLHCPMSDFSWSWNRHCSVWVPSLRRSCVWVIPSQGNKLKTHMYQASPTTTPWQA